MRRALAIAAVLVLPLQAASPSLPESGRAALAAFLRERVARGDVPAIAVVVVNRDRELFLDAAGMLDAKAVPMAPNAIFRIASMTKPVTSLAVMMLVEQGRIGLDDRVTKYLPEFARREVVLTRVNDDGSLDTRPAKRPVTIRDLLTNTSGIGYAFSDVRIARIAAKAVPEAEQPLLHDPGERFTYGANTWVLGRIIELVSGQTLDLFLHDKVFGPLRMGDTFYAVPPDRSDRVVTQVQRGPEGLSVVPNPPTMQSPVRGDGGLFSTATDYGTFMRLFLNGGRAGDRRLVSEKMIQLMTSNQIGAVRVVQQPTADAARSRPFPIGSAKDTFGFGFQIETAPIEPGLRSAGSYSWGGIYNTHFWIDPERQVAAAVLMQVLPYYDEACLNVLRGFERRLYEQLR
jgi:CubicO group peptidase (beta-lactamase class C family)